MLQRAALPLAFLALAGCGAQPGATLFAPSDGDRAVVDQASVAATDEDGFPNVLVTPAPVPGEWQPPERVARTEAALAARGTRTEGAAAQARAAPSYAEALRRRGATHAEAARREIEASGRAAR